MTECKFNLERYQKQVGKLCPCIVPSKATAIQENICPCKEFNEKGKCICKLFICE